MITYTKSKIQKNNNKKYKLACAIKRDNANHPTEWTERDSKGSGRDM